MTPLGGQPTDLVRVELDLDGDGDFEREILPSPTWAEIDDD